MSGESANIRWSPVQKVETVLISVLSLLDDANCDSPANVDASVMYRDNPAEYKKRAEKDCADSKQDIPDGFVMPTTDAYAAKKKTEPADSFDDWADSDAEDFDFDDSDVDDEDMEMDGVESEDDDDV